MVQRKHDLETRRDALLQASVKLAGISVSLAPTNSANPTPSTDVPAADSAVTATGKRTNLNTYIAVGVRSSSGSGSSVVVRLQWQYSLSIRISSVTVEKIVLSYLSLLRNIY